MPGRAQSDRRRRPRLRALATTGASRTPGERVGLVLLSTGGAFLTLAVITGMFYLCGFTAPSYTRSFWLIVAAACAFGGSGALVSVRSQRR